MNQPVRIGLLFSPIDKAQVEARTYLANLVANPLRHDGGVRVIQNDALFFIKPARSSVYLGRDGFYSAEEEPILQYGALRIGWVWLEYFALPGKNMDESRDRVRDGGARRNNRFALALAVGNRPGGGIAKYVVELLL